MFSYAWLASSKEMYTKQITKSHLNAGFLIENENCCCKSLQILFTRLLFKSRKCCASLYCLHAMFCLLSSIILSSYF